MPNEKREEGKHTSKKFGPIKSNVLAELFISLLG
jgi:hypothetical protein